MNTEQVHAGIGRRIGARALDWLIAAVIVAIGQVLLLVADGAVMAVLGVIVTVLALGVAIYNQVIRVGRTGQSVGKQALGLWVVDQDRREPIGIGPALGREVVNSLLFAACWIPGIVNLVITAKDVRRQGWHDKAVRSVVVSIASSRTPAAAGQSRDRPAPEAGPRPPSLATDATGPPTSYTPSAPPAAPRTAPPPPTPTPEDGPIEATVTSKPGTGMVGPPPGVVPPPPATDTPAGTPAEHAIAPEPDEPPEPQATPSRGTPVEAGRPVWRLTTPTGSVRELEGLLLVGRDPDSDLVAGAEAWAVDDPQLTVSKTHALLGVEDDTAWIEDWHSTNGVALHRGEAALVIEPHARTPLRDEDVIELGAYRISVEVGR